MFECHHVRDCEGEMDLKNLVLKHSCDCMPWERIGEKNKETTFRYSGLDVEVDVYFGGYRIRKDERVKSIGGTVGGPLNVDRFKKRLLELGIDELPEIPTEYTTPRMPKGGFVKR